MLGCPTCTLITASSCATSFVPGLVGASQLAEALLLIGAFSSPSALSFTLRVIVTDSSEARSPILTPDPERKFSREIATPFDASAESSSLFIGKAAARLSSRRTSLRSVVPVFETTIRYVTILSTPLRICAVSAVFEMSRASLALLIGTCAVEEKFSELVAVFEPFPSAAPSLTRHTTSTSIVSPGAKEATFIAVPVKVTSAVLLLSTNFTNVRSSLTTSVMEKFDSALPPVFVFLMLNVTVSPDIA